MSDPTEQTKIGEQEEDNIANVNRLILGLVNAPAYALFMVYKDFKRDLDNWNDIHKVSEKGKALQTVLDILKIALAYQGVDADSEKL